jgi:hypothetical protein
VIRRSNAVNRAAACRRLCDTLFGVLDAPVRCHHVIVGVRLEPEQACRRRTDRARRRSLRRSSEPDRSSRCLRYHCHRCWASQGCANSRDHAIVRSRDRLADGAPTGGVHLRRSKSEETTCCVEVLRLRRPTRDERADEDFVCNSSSCCYIKDWLSRIFSAQKWTPAEEKAVEASSSNSPA